MLRMGKNDLGCVAVVTLVLAAAFSVAIFGLVTKNDEVAVASSLAGQLKRTQDEYLKQSNVGEPPDEQVTTDLLQTGADLVRALRSVQVHGGTIDQEVLDQLSLVPRSIGCRSLYLNQDQNEDWVAIMTYLNAGQVDCRHKIKDTAV